MALANTTLFIFLSYFWCQGANSYLAYVQQTIHVPFQSHKVLPNNETWEHKQTNKQRFDKSNIRNLSTKYFVFPKTGSNKGNKGDFADLFTLASTPHFDDSYAKKWRYKSYFLIWKKKEKVVINDVT